jgi:Protein of unknown function (DUF2721)
VLTVRITGRRAEVCGTSCGHSGRSWSSCPIAYRPAPAMTGSQRKKASKKGCSHMDFYWPDPAQLSQVISQATAPAFVLGSVAGFTSILVGRMGTVIERIRHLNEIADDEESRVHLKSDIPRLHRRIELLNGATRLALASGVSTSLLLAVGFATAFLRLQHVHGEGVLFFLTVVLLGAALFRFGQEVKIGISEADHYR